jgi:phosphatidylserine/phosphatidylglycerophosphate/cardiolipin synthase-like enzyme
MTPGPDYLYWASVLGRQHLGGNQVVPLVDGRAACKAIATAIASATGPSDYVYILGWWCDPWVNLAGPGTSLLDLLGRAGELGVQSRVLIWEASTLAMPNQRALAEAAVVALNRLPGCHAQLDAGGGLTSVKSHHQKLVVVNGSKGLVALGGGVDINADRLYPLPPPPSAYRKDRPQGLGWGSASGSGAGNGSDGTPLHDVHSLVTGPVVLPMLRLFLHRWWARSGDRSIDQTAPLRASWAERLPAQTGTQFVRVGETFNGTLRHTAHPAHRVRQVTAQDVWLRAILGARKFIYMEEQYLTHPVAAAAIRRVLPRLEHVTIVIPPSELTDLPMRWAARARFIRSIVENNPHAAKLRVYTPVSDLASCKRTGGAHLYVHAKMAVIDDQLAVIGSANCNHRGWETDSELVIASFEDRPASEMSVAKQLRMTLWAHHLGVTAAAVDDPVLSRGLWDSAPQRHVCLYKANAGNDPLLDRAKAGVADPSNVQPNDPVRVLMRNPFPPPTTPKASPRKRIRQEVAP